MDTPIGEQRDKAPKPPIVDLSELTTVDGIYSRFTWFADDAPGVSDPGETFITADFIESTGLNPANLDNGISNSEVVLLNGDTASFAGGYKLESATAIAFDFEIDYSTVPAAIEGTVVGLPASCTINLDTFEVRC